MHSVPQPYQGMGAIDGSYGRLSEGGITDGKTRKVKGLFMVRFNPSISMTMTGKLQDENTPYGLVNKLCLWN